MMTKLTICFALLVLTSCTNKDYLCDENNKCMTAIQYRNLTDYSKNGIYFLKNKYRWIKPNKDYVFIKFNEYDFYYVRWDADKLIFRCPGCKVKENRITDPNFDFNNAFTEEEKNRYEFDKGWIVFRENLKKDFDLYGMEDLK